jgi:hypothetical protein
MPPDLMIRRPAASELERALHVFGRGRVRPEAEWLVAVRATPIERLVAAAMFWIEGATARFQTALRPGVSHAQIGGALLDALVASAGEAEADRVETADLVTDTSPWLPTLRDRGFTRVRTERAFEIAYQDAWSRVMQLHRRHQADIPAGWRTEPIRAHSPEAILDVIAPHRLMPLPDVRRCWTAGVASGFDPDLSCILFDSNTPFGAFLLRRSGDLLFIDVQVVDKANRQLRSLADLCLLYHAAQRLAPGGSIQRIQFRSGASEHRQTANLALRMGGREVSRGHVLGRSLGLR